MKKDKASSPARSGLRKYNFVNKVTVHDLAEDLGQSKQTIFLWIKALQIPHEIFYQGKKPVATFVDPSDLPKLRALSAKLHHRRGTKRPTAKATARKQRKKSA